MNGTDYRTRMC